MSAHCFFCVSGGRAYTDMTVDPPRHFVDCPFVGNHVCIDGDFDCAHWANPCANFGPTPAIVNGPNVMGKAFEHYVKKLIKEEERVVLDYIRDRAHDLTTCPHDMIMDGDLGAFITFDTLPNQLIRFDIPPAFLRFPRALPIELKGIAV